MMSLGFGYWMTRAEVSFRRRCLQSVGYGILIEFLNISIGYAGWMAVVLTRKPT